MINKITSVDTSGKLNITACNKKESSEQNPSFKGLGALAISGMQMCERMPMINVTVIDMLSAILPRTIVESMTNWFAGFEAFRRESSGLVVNCLIPSIISLGIAKCINPLIMPKNSNMSGCWADSSLINKASDYYKNSEATDKIHDAMKNILGNIEGFDGKNKVIFKEALKDNLDDYAQKLTELIKQQNEHKPIGNRITHWFKQTFGSAPKQKNPLNEIVQSIIDKTHVAENIQIVDGKNSVKATSVYSMLSDSIKFFKEYDKVSANVGIEEFAKKSKKLVRTKSLLGLAIILPLAASMQYINRWITSKISGVKGAPIYDDFGKNKSLVENSPKEKEGLLRQKFISIASMLGVSLLSMMKMPSMNMLEFKGMFPTMDQARIISTMTFSSRMAAAEDKNELAEATIRDLTTFSSMYFLGDYAAKAAATIFQKKTGVRLLNDTKPLKEGANGLQKFWHWVKDVNIKSSDEVVGKTEKELKRARNMRYTCQGVNLGVSLAILGVIVPIFTRRSTKKKHEQALKLAQENNVNSKENQEIVTPLNVKYSNLTSGFRADIHK